MIQAAAPCNSLKNYDCISDISSFSTAQAAIAPGFYQYFGGNGVYMLSNGTKIDPGVRTDETRLRLILSSCLARRWQAALNGKYDVTAHGGPLYRPSNSESAPSSRMRWHLHDSLHEFTACHPALEPPRLLFSPGKRAVCHLNQFDAA
ncbi:hypothetical protein [Acidocella sp.]|uniref:hypothetical protein n=1 Tax=Acidocella sp. TaxID=50710 RepID=UPI0026041CFA|nr:hypothetical protein [Acidocella sp.]